jgi:hypothetical protein
VLPDVPPSAAARTPEATQATAWSVLLDRLEERLRRIEIGALAKPGEPVPDPGPDPSDDEIPAAVPTEAERMRLLALASAHEQLAVRFSGRRRQLQQAEHYRLGAA